MPKALMVTDMKIDVRLDEETYNDLQFLIEELGDISATDALKYSIKRAAQDLQDRLRAKSQKQIWLNSGFIGCIDESANLSSDYKHFDGQAETCISR